MRRKALLVLVSISASLVGTGAFAVECVTPRSWVPRVEASPLDANGNFVDDEIDAADPDQIISVVLALNRCPLGTDLERLAAYGTLGTRSRWLSYLVLHGVTAKAAVRIPLREDIVAFVEALGTDEGGLGVSNPSLKVRPSIDYSPNTVDEVYPGSRGAGVNIAIVDTGVDDDLHETFGTMPFVAGANCVTDPCQPGNPDDDNGHGTAIAGIALGTGGIAGTYQGIARQSGLIDVKVLDAGLAAVGDSALRGLEWLADRQAAMGDVDVINFSIFRSARSNGTDVRSQMLNRLVQLGSVVVAIAGNCQQIGQPPRCAFVPEYGAADLAITVANSDHRATISRADDRVFSDSMQGPRWDDFDADTSDELKPDLAAPGTNIVSAAFNTSAGYATQVPGTSFAAPHVAGCAAILLQQDPTLRPLAVKQLLIDTAEKIGTTGWDSAWGNGLLDCFAAVDYVSRGLRTDVGFGGYPCGSGPGGSICWLIADLRPENESIREGVPNAILATVRNFGFRRSTEAKLHVGIYAFSNGQEGYEQCVLDVPALDPYTAVPAPLRCPWTPRPLAPDPTNPGATVVHGCLKSEVVYPLDSDVSNNRAQHNVNIERARSPAAFQAQVFNTTGEVVTVDIGGQCSNGECQGWSYTPQDNGFVLGADACPRTLEFLVEPIASSAARDVRIDWAVRGFNLQGQPLELGGFSTRAALGCATSNLEFADAAGYTPKSRITWSPDSSFTACLSVFDVVRGDLPIVPYPGAPQRGDFSQAACLADNTFGTEFVDAALPQPGTGFYYLTRAGGSTPGTLDGPLAHQAGSRDDTFSGCP